MDKFNETIRTTIGNLVLENLQLKATMQDLQTQLVASQALVAKLSPAPEEQTKAE